jgi:protein TonB
LLLSLLLHGLAVIVLNLPWPWQKDTPPQSPPKPIRVSFVRPEKVEAPQQAEVFAEASSRAQTPEGPRAELAKSAETVLPKPQQLPSQPVPPAPAQPPATKPVVRQATRPPAAPPTRQPSQPPRREARVKPEPPPQETVIARREPERLAKAPEPIDKASPETQAGPSAPSQPTPEAPAVADWSRPKAFGRIPLLSGEDLEKYAQVRAADRRSAAGETIALDTQELKYLSYFAHIKRRIERVWSYPPEAIAEGLQGQLHLKFVLQRNGQVKTVELLRSSGYKVLDKEAWDAVLNAGPFNPFPPLIPEDELHITARFTYVLDEAVRRTRVR